MKNKELEIALTTYIALEHNQDECSGFIDGYKQCQEDMKEYIFEVARQFHRLGKYYSNISDTHFTDIYEETINAINKQLYE